MYLLRWQRPSWDHMWGAQTDWGWGWMVVMMLFWAVLLAVLVWLGYRVVKAQGWIGDGGRRNTGRAEQILHERYARGELDRETYLRMLGDLRREDRAD